MLLLINFVLAKYVKLMPSYGRIWPSMCNAMLGHNLVGVSEVCVEGEFESWGRALLEGKGSIHTWPKNPMMARISEYLSSDSFPDSFGDALVTH